MLLKFVFSLFMTLGISSFLSSLSSVAVASPSQEVMGRFRLSELFLSPRLHFEEPGQGGFELEQSSLGFEWSRDEWVRGVLKLGSADLVRPAFWYTPQREDFSVAEAWMEGRGDYGDIRAGLVSVPQGFEGAHPELNAIFPESAPRRRGWIVQRDLGVQFRFETKPFATSMTIHNGETGPNVDRWLWASGLWEYRNSDGVGILLTGSVGHTRQDSTLGATAPQAEGFLFNTADSAKIRYAILTLYRHDRRNLFLIEGGRGEVLQSETKHPYAWGRMDLSWNFSQDMNALVRLEQTQAALKDSLTIQQKGGFGLVLSSKDNLQSVTFFASKNKESIEVQNDEFLMIFRLHSNLL
jgi:hypothetical protein